MLMSIAKTVAMPRDRIVGAGSEGEGEERQNYALRPLKFAQYIGQESLIHKLRIAVEAARSRQEPVDHMLLHGPPGLGKTTLAHVVANEVGAQVHVTNGPALTKGADLVGILTKLQRGDVLFIDEIHRLSAVVEEYLYPAMEDFKVDVTLDQGAHARTVTIPLPPFTLIGATTRIGLLTGPMRGRFGISERQAAEPGRGGRRPLGTGQAKPRHAARRQPAAPPRPRLRRGEGGRPAHSLDHQSRTQAGGDR